MVNNGHMGVQTPKCVIIQTGSLQETQESLSGGTEGVVWERPTDDFRLKTSTGKNLTTTRIRTFCSL